jgi:hypothetical protein
LEKLQKINETRIREHSCAADQDAVSISTNSGHPQFHEKVVNVFAEVVPNFSLSRKGYTVPAEA